MRTQWLNTCKEAWYDGVSMDLGIEMKADV